MRLLFCADFFDTRAADPAFAHEVAAADALGVAWDVFSYEALVGEGKVRGVRGDGVVVYRGWMMRPSSYGLLCDGVAGRLVNDVDAYRFAHWLPEWYPAMEGSTPRSVWTRDTSMDAVMSALEVFGGRPVVVKDFVKSRKHEWNEACFIPSSSDRGGVERVVRRFLELTGDDLNEGLVFREFVELERVGVHPQSGMPLSREHRVFFLDGEPLLTIPYWTEAGYAAEAIPPSALSLARGIRSRFFTLDFARRADGEWLVIEAGDGQVAGVDRPEDARALLAALRDRLQA